MSTEQTPTQETPGTMVPVVLAWLLPGAGHLALKRPWPALFVAAGVLPLFVLGMYLTGWENVSWTRHPYYFALQAPAGAIALVGEFLTRGVVPPGRMPHETVGTLYSAVAGLLNLVAITDVWARTQRGDPESQKPAAHGDDVSEGAREATGA